MSYQYQQESQVPILPPLLASVGVLPQFYAQQSTTLVLRQKLWSWSNGDFVIKTVDGQPVLRADGDAMSISRRIRISDMNGNLLFSLRKQVFSMLPTFFAEDPTGKEFMRVVGKWSFGSSKSEISFINAGDGRELVLNMKGNFFDTVADIKLDGVPIVEIHRNLWSARSIFGGAQTYTITVAPGMDMALAVAMCISLEERENTRNQ